jgi:hypothetical protein
MFLFRLARGPVLSLLASLALAGAALAADLAVTLVTNLTARAASNDRETAIAAMATSGEEPALAPIPRGAGRPVSLYVRTSDKLVFIGKGRAAIRLTLTDAVTGAAGGYGRLKPSWRTGAGSTTACAALSRPRSARSP